MTEKELDAKIDKAPEDKVKQCLKIIASLWFVEESYPLTPGSERTRKASFNKELNSDTLEAVTGELARFGFCPPQEKS